MSRRGRAGREGGDFDRHPRPSPGVVACDGAAMVARAMEATMARLRPAPPEGVRQEFRREPGPVIAHFDCHHLPLPAAFAGGRRQEGR